jgi:hypothetical protein
MIRFLSEILLSLCTNSVTLASFNTYTTTHSCNASLTEISEGFIITLKKTLLHCGSVIG